jgi:hypothetical protein
MNRHPSRTLLSFLVPVALCLIAAAPAGQDWTHSVRIAAWGLHSKDDAPRIIREAQESHVFGIEVDNDIPGRYESFLHPEEKLAAIRAVADEAHRVGNHAFVYIAGLECITANADQSAHSLAKDHPGVISAIIVGSQPFSEEALRSGLPKVTKTWDQSLRAGLAQDLHGTRAPDRSHWHHGIYVDIPYWMTHFDGWENSGQASMITPSQHSNSRLD